MHMLERSNVLNFVVTGQVRCGAAVVQSSVRSHPEATCHGDVLGRDVAARKVAHEMYFGDSSDDGILDYCHPQMTSAEQYLTTRIFDHAMYGESAVGVKILYDDILEHQLWDYLKDWCRIGDFCMVHIHRNPIACYVSLKQAVESGVWNQSVNDHTVFRPPAITGDMEELTMFVRHHAMCENKVVAACDDRLEITYKELFLNYPNVMAGIFDFLSLPAFVDVTPSIRRLKNRNIKDRMRNFDSLKAKAPYDVKEYFDSDIF